MAGGPLGALGRARERGVDGMRGPASCERARRRHGQLPSCADLPHRGPAPHRMGVWRRLGRVARAGRGPLGGARRPQCRSECELDSGTLRIGPPHDLSHEGAIVTADWWIDATWCLTLRNFNRGDGTVTSDGSRPGRLRCVARTNDARWSMPVTVDALREALEAYRMNPSHIDRRTI